MKKRRFCGILLCICLLAVGSLPAYAAADVATEANAAAGYLRGTLEEPGIGDELAILALARGSYITAADSISIQYVNAALDHIEDGGLENQGLYQIGMQGLALAALGVEVDRLVPELALAFLDADTVNGGGLQAQWAALMLFGPAGVTAPAGLDILAVARALAGNVSEENGYGDNPIHTALAVQALAFYEEQDETVAAASLNGQFWQQLTANDFGGYNVDGEDSLEALAEAILSVACLGYDPAHISYESASMTGHLVSFQREDGSLDEMARTNALATLALVAKQRYDRGSTAVYDFSDVVLTEYPRSEREDAPAPDAKPEEQEPASAVSQSDGQAVLARNATWITLAVIGAVLLVLVGLVAGWSQRKRKKRGRRY